MMQDSSIYLYSWNRLCWGLSESCESWSTQQTDTSVLYWRSMGLHMCMEKWGLGHSGTKKCWCCLPAAGRHVIKWRLCNRRENLLLLLFFFFSFLENVTVNATELGLSPAGPIHYRNSFLCTGYETELKQCFHYHAQADANLQRCSNSLYAAALCKPAGTYIQYHNIHFYKHWRHQNVGMAIWFGMSRYHISTISYQLLFVQEAGGNYCVVSLTAGQQLKLK